ncbi:MAG: hypothetical protein AAFX03_08350 [Pseudomonadota bacterium]
MLDQVPRPWTRIFVDGHVWVGVEGRPGLGARLFDALAGGAPVIGVAKSPLKDDRVAVPVRRGASIRPLFVSAIGGISAEDAAREVERLAGAHRLPDLMKQADRAARDGLAAPR